CCTQRNTAGHSDAFRHRVALPILKPRRSTGMASSRSRSAQLHPIHRGPMNTLIKRLALFGVLSIAFTALCAEPKQAAHPTAKPTIVLVHGAFADSSSWNDVASDLVIRGYPVVAAA